MDKIITIARASGEKIRSGYEFFDSKLQRFKELIDSDVDEDEIRDLLFDCILILDFQYLYYRKNKEESVSKGEIDISLFKDEFGLSRIAVVELKKSSKK